MIYIQNLTKTLSDRKLFEIDILSINKNEKIALIGENGTGKSSLINSINGLAVRYDNAKTKGEIIIDGKNIKELELYQISMLVSTVFQNPKTYFFNVNTTLELLFYLENIGLAREEMDRRLKDMLEIFPIKNLLNRNIFNLSGGEKQILCVAASYIAGTKIIVMDEPSSNLDIKSISVLTKMLKILKEKSISIIVAEHRIYYLMDIVDRVLLIDKGILKKTYTRSEFLKFDKNKLNALSLRDKELSKLEVPYLKDGGEYQIKNLSYKFTDDECLSIKDISFKLGKIYGIIGSNGRGKSTLLRCLIGLEKKSKEEIYFRNKKMSKKDRLKNSSLVMQDVNHQLFTDEVFKELSIGVKNFDEEKAKIILKDLGLDEFRERHPMSLSGGQKQRLAIASLMCKDSPFVYYDEPTSGMDYSNMMKISELIKKYRNKDKIIFIVSHDIEFLNEVADEIFEL